MKNRISNNSNFMKSILRRIKHGYLDIITKISPITPLEVRKFISSNTNIEKCQNCDFTQNVQI